MAKKIKPLTPEQETSLFKKLYGVFFKTKFTDQEINPQSAKSQELPPQTVDKEADKSNQSLADIITGLADQTRSQENDRYLRYKDYDEMCLKGDTKISLLNGKSITIQDWTEKYPDKIFSVYSYDINSKALRPAIAHSPRVTRKNADLFYVELSNGKEVYCTPDHKFLLVNGEYIEAQNLEKGMELQCLAKRISKKSRDSLADYEMVKEGKWKFTHRVVAENEFSNLFKNRKINTHHIDEDKRNNSPENLAVLLGGEHKSTHDLRKFKKENIGTLFPIPKEGGIKELKDAYLNSNEIITVTETGMLDGNEEKMYDVTVPKYKNFLLDAGVFVHNCADPVIGGSVETYADESTQRDEGSRMFTISAKDRKTEKLLDELFFDKLRIDDIMWKMSFEMCKYGDLFYEIVFNKKLDDILYLKYVSPYRMFRIEKEGKLKGFEYLTDTKSFLSRKEGDIYKQLTGTPDRSGSKKINPYKIIHFKIDDNRYEPYGRSILDTSRTTWKQLTLLEDAVLVYRLVRAPERRVWYIDTGQLSTDKAIAYTQKVKEMLRKKPIIDPLTGRINDTKKAISYVEDFWIPVRAGSTGNKIETLPGAQRLGEVDDLEYFRSKILYYMRIPKAFFTDEGSVQLSGKSLAAMDIFFGRAIERIQTFLEKGLYKIAYIYLILKNVKPEKIKSVEINLTNPSLWAEASRYETLTQKFGLMATIKSSQLFPDVWILKEIMGLEDDEIISVLGLMQAQLAGQDIVAILTGEPNPFAQPVGEQPPAGMEAGMEGALGAPPAGGGIPPAAGEMGLGGEVGGVGVEAPPEGSVAPLGGAVPEGTVEPTLSPTDYAIKALLNLENKNLTLKQREEILTEVVKLKEDYNKNVKNGSKKLLSIINERKDRDKMVFNGLTNAIVTGSLGGLMTGIKRNRADGKEKLISEEDLLKARAFKSAKSNPANKLKQDIHLEKFQNRMKNIYDEPVK